MFESIYIKKTYTMAELSDRMVDLVHNTDPTQWGIFTHYFLQLSNFIVMNDKPQFDNSFDLRMIYGFLGEQQLITLDIQAMKQRMEPLRKALVERVFHPERLAYITKTYSLTLEEYFDRI